MTHDPFPREPLTPEEQALARRLAQLGPQAEPSPALDARILAAARAADAGQGVRAMRRQPRRWPVALGVAASLVLAIGLAWRLRPLPGPAMERESAAPMAPAKTPSGAGTEGEAMPVTVVPPPHDTAASVAPPPPPPAKPLPSRVAQPNLPVATAPVVAPEPPAVLEAAPAAPMAAPLPAPPAPAEPRAQARSKTAQVPLDRVDATGSHARPSDNAPAEQAMEETGVDAAAAADLAAGDEPESEVPPATADSPDVRAAWLQRIRELIAAGHTDAARASLKEFVRRHPDAPVPDDLRALQQ